MESNFSWIIIKNFLTFLYVIFILNHITPYWNVEDKVLSTKLLLMEKKILRYDFTFTQLQYDLILLQYFFSR